MAEIFGEGRSEHFSNFRTVVVNGDTRASINKPAILSAIRNTKNFRTIYKEKNSLEIAQLQEESMYGERTIQKELLVGKILDIVHKKYASKFFQSDEKQVKDQPRVNPHDTIEHACAQIESIAQQIQSLDTTQSQPLAKIVDMILSQLTPMNINMSYI